MKITRTIELSRVQLNDAIRQYLEAYQDAKNEVCLPDDFEISFDGGGYGEKVWIEKNQQVTISWSKEIGK